MAEGFYHTGSGSPPPQLAIGVWLTLIPILLAPSACRPRIPAYCSNLETASPLIDSNARLTLVLSFAPTRARRPVTRSRPVLLNLTRSFDFRGDGILTSWHITDESRRGAMANIAAP